MLRFHRSSNSGASTPSQPRLHFSQLPDLVHGVVASFLANNDALRLMETGRWPLEVYGPQITRLVLRCPLPNSVDGKHGGAEVAPFILARRPQVTRVCLKDHRMTASLADCFRKAMSVSTPSSATSASISTSTSQGYGSRSPLLRVMEMIRGLEIYADSGWDSPIRAFLGVLRDGACSDFTQLEFSLLNLGHEGGDAVVRALGDTLGSRQLPKTGRRLESLGLQAWTMSTPSLSCVLSSGACETLQVLRLEGVGGGEAVAQWLTRTKAPHLTSLILTTTGAGSGYTWHPFDTASVIKALTAACVAPGLQILSLPNTTSMATGQEQIDLNHLQNDHQHVGPGRLLLANAIKAGAWPGLSQLRVGGGVVVDIPKLVEALSHNRRELTALALTGSGVDVVGGLAVARALGQGAWPRLEDMDFEASQLGDEGVVELARALGKGGGAALRRLKLTMCDVGVEGAKELAMVFARKGCCPRLQQLDMSANEVEDEGVIYLAEALERGGLPDLRELRLESVDMEDRGALALAKGLSLGRHKKLAHLFLRDNFISHSAVAQLVARLKAIRPRGAEEVEVMVDDYHHLDDSLDGGGSQEEQGELLEDEDDVQRGWELLAIWPPQ